jgi:hypothetical protein
MENNNGNIVFKVDFVSIDFIDENFENGWRYIMGFDSGDDYTQPIEFLETMDDESSKKIEEIRKISFPRD